MIRDLDEETLAQHLETLHLEVLEGHIGHDETITPDTWFTATIAATEHAARLPHARLSQALRLPTLAISTTRSTDADADLELGELLGEGGMGRVIEATQSALRRNVAVKMLRVEFEDDPARGDALLDEALTMGQLEHPNIIPVYTLGQTDRGSPILVMRRVRGISWQTFIDDPEHPLWRERERAEDPLAFHIDVAMRLCDAVDYAHTHDVIHRDIKPDNVMLGDFGEVYLVDWGVALRQSREAPSTRTSLVGTPSYMAPEMVLGDPSAIGPPADIFLLGASLYEALTGSPPRVGESLRAVLLAAGCAEPLVLPSTVPTELTEIIQRATAADPGERFESARALRSALARFLKHRGSTQLAEATSQRLEALEALAREDDPARRDVLQTCFNECLFGFQLALREWPDNPMARDGLRHALERMVDVELKRHHIEAARRLYAQLDAPDPALSTRLTAATDEADRTRREVAALQAHQREFDLARGHQARSRMIAIVCSLGVTLTVGVWAMAKPGEAIITHLQGVILAGIVVALFGGCVWVWRRRALGTRINRLIAIQIFLTMCLFLFNRIIHALIETPIPTMLLTDLITVGGCITAGALMIHRTFFTVGSAFLIGAVAMALWPEWYFEIFNTSIILASCTMGVAFQKLNAVSDTTPLAADDLTPRQESE